MLPVFAPFTDLKRDYTFSWVIIPQFSFNTGSGSDLSRLLSIQESSVKTILTYSGAIYVCQFAQKIQLPDDVLTTENVQLGPLSYPYANKWEMNPITVTYLEDSYNSVYMFHRCWQQQIRTGQQLSLEPLQQHSAIGIYTQTTSVSELLDELKTLSESTDQSIQEVPTAIATYPQIFPTKISRSQPDKSSSTYGTCTVTYSRVPKIKKWTADETVSG